MTKTVDQAQATSTPIWTFELAGAEVARGHTLPAASELQTMLSGLHWQAVLGELTGRNSPERGRSRLRLVSGRYALALLGWNGLSILVATGRRGARVSQLLPAPISAAEALWLSLVWPSDPEALDDLATLRADCAMDEVIPYHWHFTARPRPDLTPLGLPGAPLSAHILGGDRSGWPYEPQKATSLVRLNWAQTLERKVQEVRNHFAAGEV